MKEVEGLLNDLNDCVQEIIDLDQEQLASKGNELVERIGLARNSSTVLKSIPDDLLTFAESARNVENGRFVLKFFEKKLQLLKEELQGAEGRDDGGLVYKLITPLKEKQEFRCESCPETVPPFSNAMAFKRHCKKTHDVVIKPEEVKVSCMLEKKGRTCNRKLQMSMMYRHIEDVHKFPKRTNPDDRLKYFKSIDGGKSYCEPVYVGPTSPEPEAKYILINEEDGGCNFEEDGEQTAADIANNNAVEIVGEDVGSEIEKKRRTEKEDGGSNFEEDGEQTAAAKVNDKAVEIVGKNSLSEMEKKALFDRNNQSSLDQYFIQNTNTPDDNYNVQNDAWARDLSLPSDERVADAGNKEDPRKVASDANQDTDQFVDVEIRPEAEGSCVTEESLYEDKADNKSYCYNANVPMDIEDEIYSSQQFDKPEKKVIAPHILEDDQSNDSHFEEGDSEEMKKKLGENKKKRHDLRNIREVGASDKLADLPENKAVIEDMVNYLSTVKGLAEPTIKKTVGHIGTYPTSLLNHEHQQDEAFHLGKMISFTTSDQFFQLKDPIPWMKKMFGGEDGKQNPSDQKEMLKAHASLRDYLLFKLMSADFGMEASSLQQKRDIKAHILEIEEHLRRHNVWTKLSDLVSAENQRKKQAKELAKPQQNKNEGKCVETWFQSKEFQNLKEKNIAIYEKAIAASVGKNGAGNKREQNAEIFSGGNDSENGDSPDYVKEENMGDKKSKLAEPKKEDGESQAADTSSKSRITTRSRAKKQERKKAPCIKQKKERKVKEVAKKTDDSVIIKPQEFTAFAKFTQHTLAVSDKNRPGAYAFSNSQFSCGQKIWFPKTEDNVENLDNWDIHQEPNPSRDPDGWQIRLLGDSPGLKGKSGVTITIQGIAYDLIQMYRDLKSIVHGDQFSGNDKFFINYEGKPLSSLISNTTGGLWQEFGKATNVDGANQTSVRRGFEGYCQEKDVSRKRLKILNNHSEEVGLQHYDQAGGDFRSGVIYNVSQREQGGSAVSKRSGSELEDEIKNKRAKLIEKDEELKTKMITETLSKPKASEKPRYSTGKTMKILPDDRLYLQNLFSIEKYQSFHGISKEALFPGSREFKRKFYRMVDSDIIEDEVEKSRLQEIERRIFDVIREDKTKQGFKGVWNGTKVENEKADKIIASKVYTSLRTYEKRNESKIGGVSYFKFK